MKWLRKYVKFAWLIASGKLKLSFSSQRGLRIESNRCDDPP